MAKIKIVTDSTSDLPDYLAEEYNITQIPLNVFFGDEKFKDRINLSPSEFYGMIESGIYDWPTTSQPSAKEFLDLYKSIFEQGFDSIISIHLSASLSGTINSVTLAKNQLPDKDITIIEGNTVAAPLGMLALIAGKMNKEGKSKEEIVTTLKEKLVPFARIVGVLDTLEYLYKGGRIGRAKKILGTILKKKPLIQVKDGVVDSFGTIKNHEEGFSGLMKMVPNVIDKLMVDSIWIGYTDEIKYANKVRDALTKIPNAPKDLVISQIGPAVGSHIGPNVMTIAWIGEWDEKWFFKD
ncbi:MAG TPA: DegV family protein [candidate division Zixibacteria bacterium]|nr:DegV family protein [candidate division Zixibacteria bacterium]